jgi:hypothetical protein
MGPMASAYQGHIDADHCESALLKESCDDRRCSRFGRGLVSGLKLGNGKGNVRVLVGGG